MKLDVIKTIVAIEKEFFKNEIETHSNKKYKKIGFFYIYSFNFPFKLFTQMKGLPIRKAMSWNLRSWSIWIMSVLKTKQFQGTKLKELMGAVPSWLFLKKFSYPFSANFFYNRGSITTLLYPEFDKSLVIKTHVFNYQNQKSIQNDEIDALKRAGEIHFDGVGVPKIIAVHRDENNEWFAQKFIKAKSLGSLSFFNRRKTYTKIFKFMLEFYSKNEIYLTSINNKKIQNTTVKGYLEKNFRRKKIKTLQ